MDTSPPPTVTFEDRDALHYAMNALQFRKRQNRKRSITGELIWDDWADIALTLGLITWTSERSHRKGTRRSVFLQEFLENRSIHKTKKQISSRLQVLKNEWNQTSYYELLRDPNNPEIYLPSGAAGPRQEQSTSNATLVDHVSGGPSEGASSSHVIRLNRPDSQYHETASHEYSAIHTQARTTTDPPPTAWSPDSSSSPRSFDDDLPVQEPHPYKCCRPNSSVS